MVTVDQAFSVARAGELIESTVPPEYLTYSILLDISILGSRNPTTWFQGALETVSCSTFSVLGIAADRAMSKVIT